MSRRKIAEIISAHREYLGGELSIEEVDGGLTRSTTGSVESQLPKLKVYQFSFEALQNRFFYQNFSLPLLVGSCCAASVEVCAHNYFCSFEWITSDFCFTRSNRLNAKKN